MPKIEAEVPLEIARHLRRCIRQRSAEAETLALVLAWISTEPNAPDGDWWKDFGSFKLCGSGAYPKTILDSDMEPFGK